MLSYIILYYLTLSYNKQLTKIFSIPGQTVSVQASSRIVVRSKQQSHEAQSLSKTATIQSLQALLLKEDRFLKMVKYIGR